MVLLTICLACQNGRHDEHYEVVQAVPEGMIGGSRCRCEGECVDGRYVPAQFKNIAAAIAAQASPSASVSATPEGSQRGRNDAS